jgi:low temperature requirement protein LtrA
MSDSSPRPGPSLLRSRDHRAHVTNVELFFDLVFVFAVTQLSHTLLEHLSLAGALRTAFLLLAGWWVWMYTCWFTNWVDPDRPLVRMLLFLLMLAGLLMSAAIPNAFGHEGLLFAIAYSFI